MGWHGSNHSRGVAILFSKQSKLQIDDYHCSNDGIILLVKALKFEEKGNR